MMAKDIHGREISVGDKVRVLDIDSSVWRNLPEEEANDLKSMIGEILEVYEISENFASVEKWWQDDENHSHSHSIALHQNEMEFVK